MIETLMEAPAHKATRRCLAALCLLLGASPLAHAQAGASATDGAPSEAARRAAMSPYRFILAAPARKPPPVEKERDKDTEKEPVKKARPAPAEPPVQAAARTAPAPAPAAAMTPAAAPESKPAAAPMQTAARTRPAPPPEPVVRREVIPVSTDEPRLPAALLRERPNGLVRVQFEINPDGSTGAVKVVSSTNRVLNRPTVDAVAGWKFQPVDEILTVETEVAYKYD
jgi:TonB family protein